MSSLLPLLPHWNTLWPALIEIALLYVVFYGILGFLQATRGAGVLRGLFFVLVMALLVVGFLANQLHLYRIEYLMGPNVLTCLLIIAVLFQPEIRRLLLRLGEVPMFWWLIHGEATIVPEIVTAAFTLAQRKVGALIVIERDVGLGALIEGGTPVNAAVTSELLVTIFWPGSPLHDGAVIIRGDRIAAAACLLPLTEQPGLARTLGTRHRAAIGVTEDSDAISIAVSEETQQVSFVHRGELRMGLDKDQLQKILEEALIETVPAASDNTAKT
ncbi:MAG: diadenylate cyclase CdaA [Candidatus Brocadiia bacterium]